jgi:hypothetical protein
MAKIWPLNFELRREFHVKSLWVQNVLGEVATELVRNWNVSVVLEALETLF